MGLAEQLAHAQQKSDDEAEQLADFSDIQAVRMARAYSVEFDEIIQARDLHAQTGLRSCATLYELISDVAGHGDDSIFKSLMQGLIRCAANGQTEAVEALDGLKNYFINEKIREKTE